MNGQHQANACKNTNKANSLLKTRPQFVEKGGQSVCFGRHVIRNAATAPSYDTDDDSCGWVSKSRFRTHTHSVCPVQNESHTVERSKKPTCLLCA